MSVYHKNQREIVGTILLIFVSPSVCLLLDWVVYIHMTNSQIINTFYMFKTKSVSVLYQLLLQTCEVQKEVTCASERTEICSTV